MEKDLEKWLTSERKISKKTMKAMVKEELVTPEVISGLTEEDILQLSTSRSLSMGETVHLREARDAVLRGEFRLWRGIGGEASELREEDEDQRRDGEEDSPPGVVPATVEISTETTGVPATTEENYTTEAEKEKDDKQSVDSTKEMVVDPSARHGELQTRLSEADQLLQQGNTDTANKKMNDVVEGAQELVKDHITHTAGLSNLSGNIGRIDGTTAAFTASGNRDNSCGCCTLL